jgi:hypothetical protein
MVTKVARLAWQKEAAKLAIRKELAQLIEELVVIVPIKRMSIPKGVTILKSHMFLVNKYLADGGFDKVKARLIADGRDQNPEMFPNKSSPTVAIQSVFTVLGLACQKHWQIVTKIDIKGAFVQTPMRGPPIYIKLDPNIIQFAKEMYPEFNEFIWKDACIYTVLLKAMYGFVQASALWYALIRSVIEEMGYTGGETDKCVFVKQVGDCLYILLLYVDDILAVMDAEEAEKLRTRLEELFGTIQYEEGAKLTYLGMDVNIEDQGMTIDMIFYVKQVLEGETVEEFDSPGTKNMFIVASESKALEEDVRKSFHSKTAKLLFLAKCARPDILTVVTFLCTSVQNATEQDKDKLQRVLGYLKCKQDHMLTCYGRK